MKAIAQDLQHDHDHDDHDLDEASRSLVGPIHRKTHGGPSGGQTIEPAGATSGFFDAINAGLVMRNGDGAVNDQATTLVSRAAEGSGHALPDQLRGQWEQSLGTDLGGVRVHTGGAAQEASSALGARAYAVGQDVYMGAGEYAPDTTDGAWLLAHEVAHTVQQRGATTGPQTKLQVSEAGDAMETAADSAANAMMSGGRASVGSGPASISRHGHGPAAPGNAQQPLTPEQQHALATVRGGRHTLHRRSREDILGLVRTISAAWSAAAPHTENRRTTAQALVHLYDIMDQHLADEFDQGGNPMMAWEMSEMSMIDPWVQDAGEPSHRRHLPRRERRQQPPQVTDNPNHQVPPTTEVPRPGLPDRVDGLAAPPTVHQPSVLPHAGVEAIDFIATAAEIALHSMAGGLIGALASVAAALMAIHSGDEFNEHITEGQEGVFNYCNSFARTIRGEAGGGGRASAEGAHAAQQMRQQFLAQGGDPASLARASFIRLYGIAWRSVINDYTRDMQNHLSPGFATTEFSRDVIRARMMETRVGGLYYNAHGGQ